MCQPHRLQGFGKARAGSKAEGQEHTCSMYSSPACQLKNNQTEIERGVRGGIQMSDLDGTDWPGREELKRSMQMQAGVVVRPAWQAMWPGVTTANYVKHESSQKDTEWWWWCGGVRERTIMEPRKYQQTNQPQINVNVRYSSTLNPECRRMI